MDATMEEVEEKKLEAIYGDDEPVPKRHRHAALASPSTTLSLKLSPLAREVAQAVRVLVEADKKADDEVEEEEEEQGDDAIDVSTSSAAAKKKKKTWTSTTTTTAPPLASPEVSAAASALERLLRALSKARQVGDTVPEAMEKALDEWREGVEVSFSSSSSSSSSKSFFLPPLSTSPSRFLIHRSLPPLLLLLLLRLLSLSLSPSEQASCSRLQDLLDSSPAPPRMHPSLIRRGEEKPSAAAVAAVAGPLARRLGFTSRAPLLGWLPGQPLPPEGARPPAPQEWQIGASGLRRLFGEEKVFFSLSLSLSLSPREAKGVKTTHFALPTNKKQ